MGRYWCSNMCDCSETTVFEQIVLWLHLTGCPPHACVFKPSSSQVKQTLISGSASESHLLCASIVWKQTWSAFLSLPERWILIVRCIAESKGARLLFHRWFQHIWNFAELYLNWWLKQYWLFTLCFFSKLSVYFIHSCPCVALFDLSSDYLNEISILASSHFTFQRR